MRKDKFADEIEQRFIENEQKSYEILQDIGSELSVKLNNVFFKPTSLKL